MDKMACLGDHHKLVFSCRQTRNTNGGAKRGCVGIMDGGLVEGGGRVGGGGGSAGEGIGGGIQEGVPCI